MEKRRIFVKEMCPFIYTRKSIEFSNEMSLINCLMGLEGGYKSTPTVSPPKFVERDETNLCELYEYELYE